MKAHSLALVTCLACCGLSRGAHAQDSASAPPKNELLLQGAVGGFPYIGLSALATLRRGSLALGSSFSGGTTFNGGRAWEGTAGVGFGAAGERWVLTAMPVAGIVNVHGVAVDGDCGLFGVARCNSGLNATLPILGLRVQAIDREGHFVNGVLFGLDYTLRSASQGYAKCPLTVWGGGNNCSAATARMTRVLLTVELAFGGSLF